MIELYEEKELDELEEFISQNIGEFTSVIHELVSPDIHLDIAIVEPSEERPYCTLVTMGVGAHLMNVPEKLKHIVPDRCELLIDIPKDWQINSHLEKWYWVQRWLKIIGRTSIDENSWIGYGHTFGDGKAFGENTRLNAISLIDAYDEKEHLLQCHLSTNKTIHFYQLLPLFPEELTYKIEKGNINDLIQLFDEDFSLILDIDRKNYAI